MRTERRHELETNTLAQTLARWLNWFKPYFTPILGILIAVAIVATVVSVLSRQSGKKQQAAWDAYYLAMSPGLERWPLDTSELQELAKNLDGIAGKQTGSTASPWTQLALADVDAAIGTEMLFQDREKGRQRLEEAVTRYQSLEDLGADEMIRIRTLLGLARAYESLGRLNEAKGAYQELEQRGMFANFSRARIAALNRPDIEQFYGWFVESNGHESETNHTPATANP